jgi:hypothetical protein
MFLIQILIGFSLNFVYLRKYILDYEMPCNSQNCSKSQKSSINCPSKITGYAIHKSASRKICKVKSQIHILPHLRKVRKSKKNFSLQNYDLRNFFADHPPLEGFQVLALALNNTGGMFLPSSEKMHVHLCRQSPPLNFLSGPVQREVEKKEIEGENLC